MATREIVRTFAARHVTVATVHPQFGQLDRGRVYPQPHRGWAGVWSVVTVDAELVTVVGDYLDAEQVLLDATSGLDELAPLSELIDEQTEQS